MDLFATVESWSPHLESFVDQIDGIVSGTHSWGQDSRIKPSVTCMMPSVFGLEGRATAQYASRTQQREASERQL